MAAHVRRGNARRSHVCAAIEHVFAQQKGPMALRLVFHERLAAAA